MNTKNVLVVCSALAGGFLSWKALRRPSLPIRGKVVIITGASAGIGRAAAHAFAAQGANVVLAARRADVLKEVERELERYDTFTLIVPTDITDDDDLAHLVSETVRVFNRIDILINNAGLGKAGALWKMEAHHLHAVLQTNLYGTFRLTQLVLPIMLEQEGGHIVNVSSYGANVHVPGLSVYSASKSGIVTFSNCLRRELSGTGIYVSTILPGTTRTAMTATAIDAYFNSDNTRRSVVLAPLSKVIHEPHVPAQVIVKAVRYRKREVLVGGPFVAVITALEKLVPGLIDSLLSRLDASSIISMTERFGA